MSIVQGRLGSCPVPIRVHELRPAVVPRGQRAYVELEGDVVHVGREALGDHFAIAGILAGIRGVGLKQGEVHWHSGGFPELAVVDEGEVVAELLRAPTTSPGHHPARVAGRLIAVPGQGGMDGHPRVPVVEVLLAQDAASAMHDLPSNAGVHLGRS